MRPVKTGRTQMEKKVISIEETGMAGKKRSGRRKPKKKREKRQRQTRPR